MQHVESFYGEQHGAVADSALWRSQLDAIYAGFIISSRVFVLLSAKPLNGKLSVMKHNIH